MTQRSTKNKANSVFEDLGFSPDESRELSWKADLGIEIFKLMKKKNLSQEQIGATLSLDQGDVSRIMNGKFARFSTDKLLTILSKLGAHVDLQIWSGKSKRSVTTINAT